VPDAADAARSTTWPPGTGGIVREDEAGYDERSNHDGHRPGQRDGVRDGHVHGPDSAASGPPQAFAADLSQQR
jgi:hypothetical protein